MQEEAIVPIKIKSKLASTPKKKPQFFKTIKDLRGQEVTLSDPDIVRSLVILMNQAAVNGGAAAHWGGPSAYAEIMSALHAIMFSASDKNKEWYERFNFVNDAGHAENGIYAIRANYGFDGMSLHDLLKFRSIKSKLTGHGEGHLNPEGVLISNGPLGSGLPQAQGLAIADKLLKNDRTTICVISDGACMEGEAKEAIATIPGFCKKGKMNPFLMVLSDNNTKLSGRIDKDSYSMLDSFEALAAQGWHVIKVDDGHNLEKVYHAVKCGIEQLEGDSLKPVCLWIKTIKGKGLKETESASSGGHGYPGKPHDKKFIFFIEEVLSNNIPGEVRTLIDYVLKESEQVTSKKKKTLETVKTFKVQDGLSAAAIDLTKKGYPIYSVSSDVAGSTGMKGFQTAYPDRYMDIGIAEANMISTAIGLSKNGLIPIVDTFAQFGITKGNLPLIMAQLSQAPIIGVFSHAGLQDAADGASHQATTYISALASIPNTILIQCATYQDAYSYLTSAVEKMSSEIKKGKTPASVILFLGRESFPKESALKLKYGWEKAQVVAKGKDAVIVASGPMLFKAIEAAEILKKDKKSVTIINNAFVNRPDVKTIAKELKACKSRLVTVEDHQILGGMGAILSHALLQNGVNFKLKSLGINGDFGQSAYLADELYKKHKLSVNDIVNAVKKLR